MRIPSCRGQIRFRKNFGGERKYFGLRVAPGIAIEPRLLASLGQETRGRPVVFDSHLRKEQSPVISFDNQEAVPAGFDSLRQNRRELREYRDLDFQTWNLVPADRRESGIMQCGADSALHNRFSQRETGIRAPDTAAQAREAMQGYERASRKREPPGRRGQLRGSVVNDGFDNGLAGTR